MKIPITWSKTAIGIASTARAPTSSRTSRPPSDGSSSSGAASTSPIATVSRRRSARFVTGSRPATPTDRRNTVGIPLGADRHLIPGEAEPDEAAADVERAAGLGDRDFEHRVEIELRAHLARDPGDDPLPLERLGKLLGRAETVERERPLAGERLEQRELVVGDLGGRRDHENPDHALSRQQGDERGAFGDNGFAHGDGAPDLRRAARELNSAGSPRATTGSPSSTSPVSFRRTTAATVTPTSETARSSIADAIDAASPARPSRRETSATESSSRSRKAARASTSPDRAQ